MQKDSLGGTITLQAQHMIAGLGSDFFGGIEAKVSEYLFAIPGVKGVEFGDGFKLVEHYGSQTNDAIYIKQKKFYTKTNHMGGILGGISNGMDLVCKIAIKPTPSIGQPQHSVNYQTMQPTILATTGRHDPCIVLRAQVVAEAYLAIAIYELILANEKA
jgi:chorismate synthase